MELRNLTCYFNLLTLPRLKHYGLEIYDLDLEFLSIDDSNISVVYTGRLRHSLGIKEISILSKLCEAFSDINKKLPKSLNFSLGFDYIHKYNSIYIAMQANTELTNCTVLNLLRHFFHIINIDFGDDTTEDSKDLTLRQFDLNQVSVQLLRGILQEHNLLRFIDKLGQEYIFLVTNRIIAPDYLCEILFKFIYSGKYKYGIPDTHYSRYSLISIAKAPEISRVLDKGSKKFSNIITSCLNYYMRYEFKDLACYHLYFSENLMLLNQGVDRILLPVEMFTVKFGYFTADSLYLSYTIGLNKKEPLDTNYLKEFLYKFNKEVKNKFNLTRDPLEFNYVEGGDLDVVLSIESLCHNLKTLYDVLKIFYSIFNFDIEHELSPSLYDLTLSDLDIKDITLYYEDPKNRILSMFVKGLSTHDQNYHISFYIGYCQLAAFAHFEKPPFTLTVLFNFIPNIKYFATTKNTAWLGDFPLVYTTNIITTDSYEKLTIAQQTFNKLGNYAIRFR